MADIVVLGAGLGGVLMAYELKPQLRKDDRLIVVNKGSTFHFVPSNPWVAVDWRKREAIEVDLAPVLRKKNIALRPEGASPGRSRKESCRARRRRHRFTTTTSYRHRTGSRLRRDRRARAA